MKRSRREQSEILAERIAEKVVNKDGTVTIKPTGWRFSDVAWMARTAIELGMLAVSSKARKSRKCTVSARSMLQDDAMLRNALLKSVGRESAASDRLTLFGAEQRATNSELSGTPGIRPIAILRRAGFAIVDIRWTSASTFSTMEFPDDHYAFSTASLAGRRRD